MRLTIRMVIGSIRSRHVCVVCTLCFRLDSMAAAAFAELVAAQSTVVEKKRGKAYERHVSLHRVSLEIVTNDICV